jgi:pyruvate ferredoxin oxidoreductase alpha subunit
MALRDAGWIQLYAETNQEAADLHIQSFRLAEELSCPVMVCVDGFILTHAYDRVDIPTQEQVDAYLPPFEPVQMLDVDDPVSIGAMVGPEAFFEVRYLEHHKQQRALELIPQLAAEFTQRFGRDSGGLIRAYHCDDAETIVIALGSVNGTIKDTVDEMRGRGVRIGALSICSFRPFPLAEVHATLKCAKRVVVLEKCLAVGIGGIVSDGVRKALSGIVLKGYTVIAGLGGRAITKRSLIDLFERAGRDELEELNFLDLNWDVVNREIARGREQRRAGPSAENILRDVGPVAARIG